MFSFPRVFDPDQPEQMDRPSADPKLLALQLQSLRTLNTTFGGRSAYQKAFARLSLNQTKPWTLLDLCTGSGDHPQSLPNKEGGKIFAMDFAPETLRQLPLQPHSSLSLLCGDARYLPFEDQSIDYVMCSLALHHFSDTDAVRVLREMSRVARKGVAVIDLIRGRRAYAALWLLTTLWMRDPYTVHDGRASVKAAFTPSELTRLTQAAGWENAIATRLPWFRQMVVYKRQQTTAY